MEPGADPLGGSSPSAARRRRALAAAALVCVVGWGAWALSPDEDASRGPLAERTRPPDVPLEQTTTSERSAPPSVVAVVPAPAGFAGAVRVTGRVLDAAGRPTSRARVTLVRANEHAEERLDADLRGDGSFALEVPAGDWVDVIALDPTEEVMALESLDLRGVAEVHVTLRLDRVKPSLIVQVADPAGAPLKARVTVSGPVVAQAFTLLGRARFAELKPGRYSVQAEVEDYVTVETVVEFAGGRQELRVVLEREPTALRLAGVVRTSRGEPCPEARVVLDEETYADTDDDGRFELPAPPAGSVRLWAFVDGTPESPEEADAFPSESLATELIATGGDQLDLVLVLGPAPQLVARVVGLPAEAGEDVDVDAELVHVESGMCWTLRLEGDRLVSLEARLPGLHLLRLDALEREVGTEHKVLLPASGVVTGLFPVLGTASIHGVVRGPDGAPVELEVIVVVDGERGGPLLLASSDTDEAGHFRIEGLLPGAAHVVARDDGTAATYDCRLAAGEEVQVDLTVAPMPRVRISATFVDGAPLADLDLVLRAAEPLAGQPHNDVDWPEPPTATLSSSGEVELELLPGWRGRLEADPESVDELREDRGAKRLTVDPVTLDASALPQAIRLVVREE